MPSESGLGGSLHGDSEAEEGQPGLRLRDCLLSASSEAALHYKVAAFHLEGEGGGEQSCSLIPIAEIDGAVLVAVPHSAWHRTANRRYLPRNGLQKPCHAEVLAASPTDRSQPHAHFKVRVWLGLLSGSLEQHVAVGSDDEAAERSFVVLGSEQAILPYGPSLVSIARDQFGFVSAAEEAVPASAEEEELFSRVRSGRSRVCKAVSTPSYAKFRGERPRLQRRPGPPRNQSRLRLLRNRRRGLPSGLRWQGSILLLWPPQELQGSPRIS